MPSLAAYDSQLSTFIIEGGKEKEKASFGPRYQKNTTYSGNFRIKFNSRKETISTKYDYFIK